MNPCNQNSEEGTIRTLSKSGNTLKLVPMTCSSSSIIAYRSNERSMRVWGGKAKGKEAKEEEKGKRSTRRIGKGNA